MIYQAPSRNPVARTYALSAFPGWTIRRFEDGTYDAAQTYGDHVKADSFAEALRLREGTVQVMSEPRSQPRPRAVEPLTGRS